MCPRLCFFDDLKKLNPGVIGKHTISRSLLDAWVLMGIYKMQPFSLGTGERRSMTRADYVELFQFKVVSPVDSSQAPSLPKKLLMRN